MVRRWRSWFLEGRQNVHDDERSSRPVTATDNAAVAAVRNVVEADHHVTIDEIMIRLPPGIEIGRSLIGTIMSDVLNFRKVCARWVPRLLSKNHKQQWMEAARAFLEMHRRDGDQLFSHIVTGDESWVNAARYCEVFTKLRAAIKRKRPGLFSRKVLLVHDNALPHAARTTQTLLENFKWEIFTHPPYSPELAPSDFHLFPALKLRLGDITDFPVTKSRQDSGRQGTSKQIDHCLYRKMEQGREEESKEPMKTDPDSESGGSPTFPKKETTFGKTQEIVPGQEDVTPPPPVSDVLGRLTTTLPQLSAVTGHRERWNRYDGSYKAQSFFTNYDAQADRAQLQYSTSLKKPPDLLQAPLRVTNTRAYVTCSPTISKPRAQRKQ
ncbi:hypothetical protein LAZ67_3001318 [Cordylochernes scorpioides]|uniref:Transposase n=1 Tax=Cordylochernes scorpioides TaxID=51811 RepID=A0ABY6K7P8_9ARAC|nr:hypothetical protein LAZ67_3001318 [Cordylochernes scorpioides]